MREMYCQGDGSCEYSGDDDVTGLGLRLRLKLVLRLGLVLGLMLLVGGR